MQKLFLETTWGPLVLFGVVAILLVASVLIAMALPCVGAFFIGIFSLLLVLLFVMLLAGIILSIVSFVKALCKRRWGSAVSQLLIRGVSCLVGICVFVCGSITLVLLLMGSKAMPQTVIIRDPKGLPEFKIEFSPRYFLFDNWEDPPIAYYRTVLFTSGRRVGIRSGSGEGAPLAVCRVSDGKYYLLDTRQDPFEKGKYIIDNPREYGLHHGSWPEFYRVNISNETVEVRHGIVWALLPEGDLEVTNISQEDAGTITISAKRKCDGTNVAVTVSSAPMELVERTCGLTVLGLAHPSGYFEKADPHEQHPNSHNGGLPHGG